MLPPGTRVIAAVSGGADSVGLLHMLRELAPEQLVGVAHFNHQLRGGESDGDEAFVAALTAGFQLPFYRAGAEPGPGNLEQNARRARRAFFSELIAQGRADRIALGHTLDDQAETVLFRMLRGSGLSGLAGILPVTVEGLVRPLLGVRRADLRAYLEQHRIAWREDSSNASLKFARNRIRHTLLPELARDWNPRVVEALAHLGDVAYEEEVWWAGELARLGGVVVEAPGSVEIFLPPLASAPRALLRRLLRRAIHRAKGDLRGIDHAHVEQLEDLAELSGGSARRALPGLTVMRSFDWLLLRVSGPVISLAPISIHDSGTYPRPPAKPLIQCVIHDHVQCDTLNLELRGWRAGDRYQPLGHRRPAKLTDLFQQARVPSWRRAGWPMVTNKGKILWAKGFGPAQDAPGIEIQEIPDAG